MMQSNLDFMQHLIDTGLSKNCIFEFVTNGTQYPAVLDQAHQFRRFVITVSIDNIGSKFELERSGASWELVDQNLTKFVACQQRNRNVNIGISVTVNIQNVLDLPGIIKYLKSKQVKHYYLNLLFEPHWMSLDCLTPAAKNLALETLFRADLDSEDRLKLDLIINHLQHIRTSDGTEFCQRMRDLDRIRKENFAETHKEIAQAMGYML